MLKMQADIVCLNHDFRKKVATDKKVYSRKSFQTLNSTFKANKQFIYFLLKSLRLLESKGQ